MQVSLQSTVYLGTCVAVCAYNAYSNYANWVSFFVIGIIWGTSSGRFELWTARANLDFLPESVYYQGAEDKREQAVKSLTSSMPGIEVTAINLLALGLITQRIPLPSGWSPQIVACLFHCLADVGFGRHVGKLFQLDILRRDQNPKIQKLLDQAII